MCELIVTKQHLTEVFVVAAAAFFNSLRRTLQRVVFRNVRIFFETCLLFKNWPQDGNKLMQHGEVEYKCYVFKLLFKIKYQSRY